MKLLNIIVNKIKRINFKKKEQPAKIKTKAKVSLKVIRKEDKTEIEIPIQQTNTIQNRNKPQFQTLPKYNNQRIKSILNIVIGEDKEYYLCLMEDDSIKAIPTHFFK